jgi:hypothetical protein
MWTFYGREQLRARLGPSKLSSGSNCGEAEERQRQEEARAGECAATSASSCGLVPLAALMILRERGLIEGHQGKGIYITRGSDSD